MASATKEAATKRLNLRKYGSEVTKSYQLTDDYVERLGSYEPYSTDTEIAYRPPTHKQVGSGSWVMIIKDVPVRDYKPKLWFIYWAVPCKDSLHCDGYEKGGRYKLDILVGGDDGTFDTVSIFPHEYMVLDELNLQKILEEGAYSLREIYDNSKEDMNMELIEKGRSLTEEEREVIWALQLDGLSENQACSEYFNSRHVDKSNSGLMYVPDKEYAECLSKYFIR